MLKNLRQLKGYTAVRFLREFESKNWTRSGLDYLLAKIDRCESVDRVSGIGRPRTACATGNVSGHPFKLFKKRPVSSTRANFF